METGRVHRHNHAGPRKPLLIAISLNLLITVFEFAGGIISGSLALISDALHNLTDTLALVISFIALRFSKRAVTERSTFGYKRAEVLAALLNSSALVVASFFLFREAVIRFMHPVEVNTSIMIGVAAVCLAANFFSALLLRKDSRDNINIKSAYVHLVTDALSSVAVIAGGILIYFLGIQWIDPLLTLIIGLYVLKAGYAIVLQAVHILMMHTPYGLDISEIAGEIGAIQGVKNVHHVHLWGVTEKDIHFEAHIDVNGDMKVSETCRIRENIDSLLKEKFNISHTTLQFESGACDDFSLIKQSKNRKSGSM